MAIMTTTDTINIVASTRLAIVNPAIMTNDISEGRNKVLV